MFFADFLVAQQVREIPMPPTGKNQKVAMNGSGELLIIGRNIDGYPELTKMDTAGNVIWQKYFDDPGIINAEPFRHDVRFDNITFDSVGNMYLFTELEKNPRIPFIVKLNPEGDLLWVSEELRGVGNSYEYDFDSWMFMGDTTLTVITGYSISMNIKLSTGEYLGIDPVLSNHNINITSSEMIYGGKHYRKTTEGFLIFDSAGSYTFLPDQNYVPFDVWHVDSFGCYADSSYDASLLNSNSRGSVSQINKINFDGKIEESVLCTLKGNYNPQAEENVVSFITAGVHPDKGIIVCGVSRDFRVDGGWDYKVWIAQIREGDFEIVYDTTTFLSAVAPGEIMFYDNTVFIHCGGGSQRWRTKLLKVNLKNADEYPVSVPQKEIPEGGRLRVYPNPAGNYFFIENLPEHIKSVTVTSVTGSQTQLNKIGGKFDISTLPPGFYVIKTQSGNLSGKFIKMR